MRVWSMLTLLASLIWFWFAYHSYCCNGDGLNQFSCNTVNEVIDTPIGDSDRAPLDFKWSTTSAFRNNGFAGYKDDILMGDNGSNVLEIVGYYSSDEENNSKYENLGLARAHQIKKLFVNEISENRVVLTGALTEEKDNARNDYFTSADFNWLAPDVTESSEDNNNIAASTDGNDPKEKEAIVKEEETPTKTVEELADKVIIRFPFNSDKKDYDPKVDAYLTKLAKQIRSTGETVSLTGHTDDQGKDKYNVWLGNQRAYQIRSILIKKGVIRKQIEYKSLGESQPMVPNTTEENRHKNRRVEVIIKK